MPRAKQENPRRNVQICGRVKRREISRHRVQPVGLEWFLFGFGSWEQESSREKSGTKRIALVRGVRARKVRGKVRQRGPGTCGNVGATSSMVRAPREWERK